MIYVLIVCRSLTYAQRLAAVLEGSGMFAPVVRSPQKIAPTGCSYAVKVKRSGLSQVLNILDRAGLPPSPGSVFTDMGEGEYQEVAL